MAAPVKITQNDLDPAGLRRSASRASSAADLQRMLTLALVPEGASRMEVDLALVSGRLRCGAPENPCMTSLTFRPSQKEATFSNIG